MRHSPECAATHELPPSGGQEGEGSEGGLGGPGVVQSGGGFPRLIFFLFASSSTSFVYVRTEGSRSRDRVRGGIIYM